MIFDDYSNQAVGIRAHQDVRWVCIAGVTYNLQKAGAIVNFLGKSEGMREGHK